MSEEQITLETVNLILRMYSLLEKEGKLQELVNFLSQIEAKAARKVIQEKKNQRETLNIITPDITPSGEKLSHYWQIVHSTTRHIKQTLLENSVAFPEVLVNMQKELYGAKSHQEVDQSRIIPISSQIIKGGKISVIGLDGAGKTTILQRLKTGRWIPNAQPTVGMNSESIQINNVRFTAWDMGGQLQFRRALWVMYTKNSSGLIFVVDVSNPQRYPEARLSIQRMLALSHLQNLPLVIFANKVDLIDKVDEEDLPNILGISKTANRKLKVLKTSAKTGQGINEGIYWLTDILIMQLEKSNRNAH